MTIDEALAGFADGTATIEHARALVDGSQGRDLIHVHVRRSRPVDPGKTLPLLTVRGAPHSSADRKVEHVSGPRRGRSKAAGGLWAGWFRRSDIAIWVNR